MAEFFQESIGLSAGLSLALAALVKCLLLLAIFAGTALVLIWVERKVSGRMQDRLGPTRVGGKFGWLQSLADGIKLLLKEDLVPLAADQALFRMAPYIVAIGSFCAFIALPFSAGTHPQEGTLVAWVAQNLDIAVFFMLAVLSLEVFGVILAGYSSGSKWSLFGAMREAAQVVSYEVPLAICAVIPVLVAGTMNLARIGHMQEGWFWNWLIFHDPFTFLAFFVFFTCATASVKRAPFDLAEAESELVAGFHTEYSGVRWVFFFMAEYASMVAVSGIATILFLGAWNGPLPVTGWLGLEYAWLGRLLGLVNFLGKVFALIFLMMWARWTLPRLRIDQVMQTCLKYLLPISCVLLLGASFWPLVLPSGLVYAVSGGTVRFGRPLGESYEARQPPATRAGAMPEAALNVAAAQPAARLDKLRPRRMPPGQLEIAPRTARLGKPAVAPGEPDAPPGASASRAYEPTVAAGPHPAARLPEPQLLSESP